MADYDAVVLGLGCAGLASCSELSKNGFDVLGLEKHTIVNKYGSSHGDVRLFRFAYHEGKEYIPLLSESANRWKELNQYVPSEIFTENGSLTIGHKDSEKYSNALRACQSSELEHYKYSGSECNSKYDMWNIPSDFNVLYQPDGGILNSREGLYGLKTEGEENGAELRTHTEVISWTDTGEIVKIKLDSGEMITTDALIITSGPWASNTTELEDLLQIERHIASFLDYSNPEFSSSNAPVWVFDGGQDIGRFYGAPTLDGVSNLKLGNLNGDVETTIDTISRDWDYYELIPEVEFARSYFSQNPSSIDASVCPLTHSKDGDFIIDSSNEFDNIYYGVGLSGHGLKLAPAIGRLVSDCVSNNNTKEMFSLDRFY